MREVVKSLHSGVRLGELIEKEGAQMRPEGDCFQEPVLKGTGVSPRASAAGWGAETPVAKSKSTFLGRGLQEMERWSHCKNVHIFFSAFHTLQQEL